MFRKKMCMRRVEKNTITIIISRLARQSNANDLLEELLYCCGNLDSSIAVANHKMVMPIMRSAARKKKININITTP